MDDIGFGYYCCTHDYGFFIVGSGTIDAAVCCLPGPQHDIVWCAIADQRSAMVSDKAMVRGNAGITPMHMLQEVYDGDGNRITPPKWLNDQITRAGSPSC